MTLTSFALMFLLILVRSVLTFLFGRFGKAIPAPPYSAFGFKTALKFPYMRHYRKLIFHLPLFWVVNYKTTLRNARKKCKKNKIVTGYYAKTCCFSKGFHSNRYCPDSKNKSRIKQCFGSWAHRNSPDSNTFSASFKARRIKCSWSCLFPESWSMPSILMDCMFLSRYVVFISG